VFYESRQAKALDQKPAEKSFFEELLFRLDALRQPPLLVPGTVGNPRRTLYNSTIVYESRNLRMRKKA
jgi:hypothetical protein